MRTGNEGNDDDDDDDDDTIKMVEFLLDCLLFGKKCAQFARSIKQYHAKVMQHVNISLSIKNSEELMPMLHEFSEQHVT